MQQATDFLDECAALHALITPLSETDFEMPTQFKGWTINDIIRHLHVWNIAVDLSLNDEAAFGAFVTTMMAGVRGGQLTSFEASYLGDLSGHALVSAWMERAEATAASFAVSDPKLRLKWVGPDMSALSSITARLMETWAHAQAIYDVLGVERRDTDRIGNIVRLGVNTWGFTWKNRRMEPPGQMPQLRLVAPSGASWEYGEPSASGMISGSATDFCQVVTQCRNVSDTLLEVTGEVSHQWMAVAQCFAGPPQDPPLKGTRYCADRGV
ncbi:TIGR03084 family metal-binding protein [Sphingorhabdus sp.]|uniref:TIGR03084 family metal-binding protein n=1 Tax=Sphingorhabdus sp. TaxID=1902408 RepID=UPI00391D0A84